ncbi:Glucosaminyl phosphatidylinositol (GlcN-PI) nositol acylation protein [Aspergillus melleus]|uniref:Glucosaminyl phosphatidylinositol (GlcN-PI) nositol acylation protein n=1 Tax=Aspergillus melleus TaxID=138277 RepID=A0ACC3B2R8_9EURO|nr:Glucosaminyl phosphatidylinositol (GlcN-PI) nositol acylation protein [Aspergillus melleus]
MDQSYKARKEAFVSNLAGGNILEINAVTLVAPASVLLWSVLQSRLSFFNPYGGPALVADFLLNVLAILFATTIYAAAPWTLNILLISPALLLLFTSPAPRTQQKAKPPAKKSSSPATDTPASLPMHPFLTTYRAAMMIVTCVAILAVDFPVFPRSVKGLDYAEHVTEYGVHWNFFFTLGLLPPFVEIFDGLATFVPSYELLALGVAALYQVALESTDLKGYILVSPRGPDLFSKNREGIFSFLGYLAIFLAGRAVGVRVIPRGTSASKSPKQARKDLLISLGVQSLVWIGLFTLNSTYAFGYGANIPVSRRLANLPYVLWVSAFNIGQLFLFCSVDTVFFPFVHRETEKSGEAERVSLATSRIMAAFNKNGLAIFLVANLLTGAVNLSVPTLDVKTPQSMAILVAYAAIITGVALAMQKANIKLVL